jgi:streptogramin lyase
MSALFARMAFGAALAMPTFVGAASLQGVVVDTNGDPVPQAQVVYTRPAGVAGASFVTVFTGSDGRFEFPGDYAASEGQAAPLQARALGYRMVANQANGATLVLARTVNQAAVAPSSAWLHRITDRGERSRFVLGCVTCHQVPAPEQRAYAAAIVDQHPPDIAVARRESWNSIVKYMNWISAWEFSRGLASGAPRPDAAAVYSVQNGSEVVDTMVKAFNDRMDSISGYGWGAPVIANGKTRIWEYEVPAPNAIREAVMLGEPRRLLAADVSANRLVSIDVATGQQRDLQIPSDVTMAPHSLHKDKDGSLWATPFFNSVVGHLDVNKASWKLWRLKTADGKDPGIHDLSFGADHELMTDRKGRIWYSDIGNNAVGYFDPKDGAARIWTAPHSPGRDGATSLYGLAMTKDRKQVWYSQLDNGTFGGFDIETERYIGPFQLPGRHDGPRRITFGDSDVLYMALFGSGQLAEFDARSRKMIGIYDLPDTGSAPYSVTWDTQRKVVWVVTANADVIYRFDPRTKAFGVLPLPRQRAYMRMLDVDAKTGVLVSSYANIVDMVQGPRMALIVDPGDDVYPERFLPTGNTPGVAASKPAGRKP